MKRKQPRRQTGVKTSDVKMNFTTKQLAGIGAVAMAYNEAEAIVDDMVGACINFDGDSHEVVSRINGMDGKIAIIKAATKRLDQPRSVIENITQALNAEGFAKLKIYRDGVIHACLLDAGSGVARLREKRGRYSDVLLSEDALDWLYQQFVIIRQEMDELHTVLVCAQRLRRSPAVNDQHKARLVESIRAANLLCQRHQHQRLSLQPPPKFPEESDILIWKPQENG